MKERRTKTSPTTHSLTYFLFDKTKSGAKRNKIQSKLHWIRWNFPTRVKILSIEKDKKKYLDK